MYAYIGNNYMSSLTGGGPATCTGQITTQALNVCYIICHRHTLIKKFALCTWIGGGGPAIRTGQLTTQGRGHAASAGRTDHTDDGTCTSNCTFVFRLHISVCEFLSSSERCPSCQGQEDVLLVKVRKMRLLVKVRKMPFLQVQLPFCSLNSGLEGHVHC
jgi:hypothetical protein